MEGLIFLKNLSPYQFFVMQRILCILYIIKKREKVEHCSPFYQFFKIVPIGTILK